MGGQKKKALGVGEISNFLLASSLTLHGELLCYSCLATDLSISGQDKNTLLYIPRVFLYCQHVVIFRRQNTVISNEIFRNGDRCPALLNET